MGCCKEKEESCACVEIDSEQQSCNCACSDTPNEDVYDFMCMYRKLSDLLDDHGPLKIIHGLVIYAERASETADKQGKPEVAEAWTTISERLSDVTGD